MLGVPFFLVAKWNPERRLTANLAELWNEATDPLTLIDYDIDGDVAEDRPGRREPAKFDSIDRKSPILKSGLSSNPIISELFFRHLAVDLRLPMLAGVHPVDDEVLKALSDLGTQARRRGNILTSPDGQLTWRPT